MHTVCRYITILSLSCLAGVAFAQDVVWVSNAMACVPTHETAEQQKYITSAGGVKFKPEAFGRISFICPFQSIGLKVTRNYHLEMSIRNLDPGRSVDHVKAEVRLIDPLNGNVSTALNTEPAQRTNSSSGRVATIRSDTETFGWNSAYTYYVQFTIDRKRRIAEAGETLAEPLVQPDPVTVFRLALVKD